MEDLANHMGLFLQKTNIIRDYLEDINEEPAPRCTLCLPAELSVSMKTCAPARHVSLPRHPQNQAKAAHAWRGVCSVTDAMSCQQCLHRTEHQS